MSNGPMFKGGTLIHISDFRGSPTCAMQTSNNRVRHCETSRQESYPYRSFLRRLQEERKGRQKCMGSTRQHEEERSVLVGERQPCEQCQLL